MKPTIRQFSSSDRSFIEGILRSDQTFIQSEIDVALELVDDALANPESEYWLRIAEIDGQAAGYICFGPTPMTDCTYDLYWIVTHADHRGKKVARLLIETMEAVLLARGKRAQVRVETSQTEGYDAARKLYERLGYPEVARFSDFYKNGDDLIVFYKSLVL